jgi:cytochrome c553
VLLALHAGAQPVAVRVHRCANCHGARGEGGATGAPRLAGLSRDYLLAQLASFAEGRRQHGVMTPLARSLRPEEREAIAAYYAGLQPPTLPPQVTVDMRWESEYFRRP